VATLNEIEVKAKAYSLAREALAGAIDCLQEEIGAAKRRCLPIIKRCVEKAKERRAELAAAIDESAELFVKPRSVIMHGVRVGFQKAKGKIEFDDPDQVVKLVRKHFPEQFDVLVKTVERPVKDALAQLPAADLKRLGITVEETGDVVLIKDTASDVDKLVEALLKDEEEVEA